jgi:hypothetical protein
MNAHEKLMRANVEAQGYLELALALPEGNENREKMRQAAIRSLDLLEDDEFVDRLYDEDMAANDPDPRRQA